MGVTILGLVGFHSEPFQQYIDKSYQESADTEPPERTVLRTVMLFETCTGYFFKEDGEAITAFFTLILGLATIGLWLSTKGLVSGADLTAERQLRAYVDRRGIEWKAGIRRGAPWGSDFVFRHCGRYNAADEDCRPET